MMAGAEVQGSEAVLGAGNHRGLIEDSRLIKRAPGLLKGRTHITRAFQDQALIDQVRNRRGLIHNTIRGCHCMTE